MKAPLFVPMKSGGPAGGALIALAMLGIFAAAIYVWRRQGSAAPAPTNNYSPGNP